VENEGATFECFDGPGRDGIVFDQKDDGAGRIEQSDRAAIGGDGGGGETAQDIGDRVMELERGGIRSNDDTSPWGDEGVRGEDEREGTCKTVAVENFGDKGGVLELDERQAAFVGAGGRVEENLGDDPGSAPTGGPGTDGRGDGRCGTGRCASRGLVRRVEGELRWTEGQEGGECDVQKHLRKTVPQVGH